MNDICSIFTEIPDYYWDGTLEVIEQDRIVGRRFIPKNLKIKVDGEKYRVNKIVLDVDWNKILDEVDRELDVCDSEVIYTEVDGTMYLTHNETGAEEEVDVYVLFEFERGELVGFAISSRSRKIVY